MRRLVTFMIAAGLAVTGLTTSSAARSGAPASAVKAASPPGRPSGEQRQPAPERRTAQHRTAQHRTTLQARSAPLGVPGGARLVTFSGYEIAVPASWPVYSLTAQPTRCVRFDRHALYLGTPGPNQDCPAHLAGRVATVSLAHGSAAAPQGGDWRAATGGRAGPISLSPSQQGTGATLAIDQVNDQAQADFPGGGLTFTATYGNDAALIGQIMRTVRLTGPSDTTAAHLTADRRDSNNKQATLEKQAKSNEQGKQPKHKKKHKKHHHRRPVKGFDTCAAPSISVMRKWRHAFSDAAIYLGGPEAACGWGNLSRDWVRSATRMGWGVIPTYVGPQAPCTTFSVRIHPGHAEQEGRAAARNAIGFARQLGIRHHQPPIYYDMEAYNGKRARCRHPVLAFLDGWTRELHRHHYHAGVYSSAGAAASDLGRASTVYGHKIAKPNVVWFGLWDGRQNLNGSPYLRHAWWDGHHRIKQYMGGHRRRVNGARLNIDSDQVYGAVYK